MVQCKRMPRNDLHPSFSTALSLALQTSRHLGQLTEVLASLRADFRRDLRKTLGLDA
jgi:hypothetical protein